MKKIFLLCFSFILFQNAYPQNNPKIYFLADTISMSKEYKFMKMEWDSPFQQFFVFFCKCAPPYKSYVTFSYINKKGDKKAEIVSTKPSYDYISLKALMDMSTEWYNYFDNKYDLYITEVLPGNKYRTNKVKFVPYQEPTQDRVILKEKQ